MNKNIKPVIRKNFFRITKPDPKIYEPRKVANIFEIIINGI